MCKIAKKSTLLTFTAVSFSFSFVAVLFITLKSADSYRLASLHDSSSNTYNREASLPSESNRNEESEDRNRWTLKTETELREISIQLFFLLSQCSSLQYWPICIGKHRYMTMSLIFPQPHIILKQVCLATTIVMRSLKTETVIFDRYCNRLTRKTETEFQESTAYSSFSHDMDSVSDKPSRR